MALRASVKANVPLSSGKLSASLGGSLRATATEISELTTFYVVLGKVVGGPPATYADFVGPVGGVLLDWIGSVSAVYDAVAELYTITLARDVVYSDITAGQEYWLAWFARDVEPDPTDVVQAAVGPFVGIA